jgi:translation initiation factor IF-1
MCNGNGGVVTNYTEVTLKSQTEIVNWWIIPGDFVTIVLGPDSDRRSEIEDSRFPA